MIYDVTHLLSINPLDQIRIVLNYFSLPSKPLFHFTNEQMNDSLCKINIGFSFICFVDWYNLRLKQITHIFQRKNGSSPVVFQLHCNLKTSDSRDWSYGGPFLLMSSCCFDVFTNSITQDVLLKWDVGALHCEARSLKAICSLVVCCTINKQRFNRWNAYRVKYFYAPAQPS